MDQHVDINILRAARPREAAPAAVWDIAKTLMEVGAPIIRRLLSDERMNAVWRELLRWPVSADTIERIHPRLRLGHYGISDQDVSSCEQAATAVFAFAVLEFIHDRPFGT